MSVQYDRSPMLPKRRFKITAKAEVNYWYIPEYELNENIMCDLPSLHLWLLYS